MRLNPAIIQCRPYFFTILLLGMLVLQGGCQSLFNNRPVPQDTSASSPEPSSNLETIASPLDPNLIVNVVSQVGPAVVRINAKRSAQPWFGPWGGSDSSGREGTGSGFIFDAQGLILTNAHVVANADQVTVVLKDGQLFPGKVKGVDPITDLAVIQIEAENLPTVKLGDSDGLQPGDWAIAIGNPLGLDNTVTMGIVSATDRSSSQLGISDRRVHYIQTDAAINPGNSGGPLLNDKGEVIGVNTAIIDGAQGIGFAIPMKMAQRISQQLVTKGEVAHAYLGIRMAVLTPQILALLKQEQPDLEIPSDKGVLIVKVQPDSPAAQANLEAGSVIVRMGNIPIHTSEELQKVLDSVEPEDQLTLEILEPNSQKRQLQLKVGRLQLDATAQPF
ncbi:MAG: trypsin-like serine protease [Acaryochloridaceae cyanobacterium SU_2_1]|nr:trypsin-like serine protease [Acaryochloridaceae cyanobacterium SU_2_1]